MLQERAHPPPAFTGASSFSSSSSSPVLWGEMLWRVDVPLHALLLCVLIKQIIPPMPPLFSSHVGSSERSSYWSISSVTTPLSLLSLVPQRATDMTPPPPPLSLPLNDFLLPLASLPLSSCAYTINPAGHYIHQKLMIIIFFPSVLSLLPPLPCIRAQECLCVFPGKEKDGFFLFFFNNGPFSFAKIHILLNSYWGSTLDYGFTLHHIICIYICVYI